MKIFTKADIFCLILPATVVNVTGTISELCLLLIGLLLGYIKKTVDDEEISEFVAHILAITAGCIFANLVHSTLF